MSLNVNNHHGREPPQCQDPSCRIFPPLPDPAPLPLAILSGPASSLSPRYRKYIASFPAISSWHRSLQLRTSAAGPAAYSAR